MGTGGSKDKDLIAEANKAANDLMSAEPGMIAYRLNNARLIFDEINRKIIQARFGPDRLATVNKAVENFSTVIGQAEIAVRDQQVREEEDRRNREAKRQRELLLATAYTALSIAQDSWRRDLEKAERDILRWSEEKPSPATVTNADFKITAEEIERRLTKARSEKERLSDLLSQSREWDDADILKWHKEDTDQVAAVAREQREREEFIAAKMDNPQLTEAFKKMTAALYLDVARCGGVLVDADVGEILGKPSPDDGATEALKHFKAPEGGVAHVEVMLGRVAGAGFPEGPIKDTLIKLIEGSAEYGTGFGARLRGFYGDVVVHGNKAGFNVNHSAVRTFFHDVALALTSEKGSDTGTRNSTTKDAGEL